jgi:hypothetical protein
MTVKKKPQKKPLTPKQRKTADYLNSLSEKGVPSLGREYSGTPYEITPEEWAAFEGRDMELYRRYWKRLEEKGLLPHEWRGQMKRKFKGEFDYLTKDVKERTLGLLAVKLAFKEWLAKDKES